LWQEIPSPIRKILKNSGWTPNFRTYCISPKQGRRVRGFVWLLTPEERQLVSKWEFWYQSIKTKIITQNGRLMTAETEIVEKHSVNKNELDGEHYKLFLNSKRQMLKIVKILRAREEI
jgi:hypothetical protein